MQELNVQPTNPTPYMPAGGMYNFNPTPGAGGLPALSGLSRNVNPMARELQAQGRGEDTMLVHMTPDEVNSLQGLAMQTGTTMTINPNTGLPEAGLLGKVFKKLLPALAGAGLMFIPGVNAIAAAGIVGGGSTLLTGSLKKGLMAGLSAYGGASLARGLGAGVASAASKAPLATSGGLGANAGITASENAFFTGLGGTGVPAVGSAATGAAAAAAPSITAAEQAFLTKAGGQFVPQAAKTGLAALPGNFAKAAQSGLPKGFISKAAPMVAASGLLGTASRAAEAARKPGQGPVDQGANWPNEGPYMPTRRTLAPRLTGPGGRGEIMYFDEPDFGGYLTASGELRGVPTRYGQPTGYAEGGSTDDKPQETSVPRPETVSVTTTGKFGPAVYQVDKELVDKYNAAVRGGPEMSFEDKFKYLQQTSGSTSAKPLDRRETMIDYAGDANAYRAMSEGRVDPNTGRRSQFAGSATAESMKPGTIQQFGDTYMRLGDDRRWYTTEAPKPTGTNTSTTTNEPVRNPNDVRRDDRPTTTNTTSSTLGYDQNTSTTKVPGLPPGATADSYGVYTLKDRYTPQFTKVEDFVTEKVNPYTGGTEQTNKLDEYIRSYRTSPGPLKSTSLGYAPGQSPSERNRAYALELAKQAEERRRAAAATTTTSNAAAGTDTGGYYYNPANGQTYANPNFTGAVFNPVTGQFEMPAPGPGNSFARGGIYMDDGAFVVDARTVSELGNGSSSAGQELLARLGGRPVKGPGDGVSDSIRANIGGTQEARVARDEVIFPAKAVKKLGGAKKLYALMDKAHKARKKAGRGSDTQLRKGLGAL